MKESKMRHIGWMKNEAIAISASKYEVKSSRMV